MILLDMEHLSVLTDRRAAGLRRPNLAGEPAMSRKSRTVPPQQTPAVYWGAEVPMRVIRRFARQVAERFQPDTIVLFGSHAYGTPHADSEVDRLVIMPATN